PHEKVGREERAEQHHLGRDEEQHSEHGCADARALMGRGRAVVSGGVGFHYPGTSPFGITCVTGSFVSSRRRSTRSLRSQPDRSGSKVETMISSIRSSWISCIAASNGSGWATHPWASMPEPRSPSSARRRRRSASACSLCV